MGWIAIGISVAALVVSILAVRYSRRQAEAVERQNQLEHEAVLRFVFRSEGGKEGEDGKWIRNRNFFALQNVGKGRALDVRVVLDMDPAGRTYGTILPIKAIESGAEEEILTSTPLPSITQLFVKVGGTYKIEQAEVKWVASDGKPRTAHLPMVS